MKLDSPRSENLLDSQIAFFNLQKACHHRIVISHGVKQTAVRTQLVLAWTTKI